MALRKIFSKNQDNLDGALVLKDAYWRVDNVFASKTSANCVVTVNKQLDGELVPVAVKQYKFTPDLSGSNFIAQAYEHLKTLPEFAGAVDC